MTIDQEIRRGEEAQRLMNEPLLKEAFETVEGSIIEAMRKVPFGDRDTQHELVLTLQLLAKVKRQMVEVIETGKLARIQKETLGQKMRRVFKAA